MPIKGLSDRNSIVPRFPRLGKLRKGGERVKGKNRRGEEILIQGPDLDHFRFTSDNPELVEVFEGVYGKEPRSIMVYLPYATVEENFPTWCEIWGASGMVHRCDGETMSIWLEGDKYIRGSKPCAGGHKDGDPLKDGIGRLSVIIPEFIQAGYVGFVTVETHSKNDIVAISSVLSEALQQRGDNPLGLRGIQFVLRRVQENISVPGFGNRAGQRSRADKWLVKIEPAVEWVKLQLSLDQKRTMLLPEAVDQEVGELPDDLKDGEDIQTGEVTETPTGDEALPTFETVEVPWTSTVVTKESAMKAESKSDGKYWDMPLDKLTPRCNEIEKMLKDNHVTPEAHELLQYKRDVVKAIIDYRNAQAVAV